MNYIDFTNGEIFSLFFITLNIVLSVILLVPQLYQNYKLKSSNAISYLLILFWFIGSTLNLISVSIKNVSISIVYYSVYSVIINAIMFVQLLYYRWYRKTHITITEFFISICLLFSMFLVSCILLLINNKNVLAETTAWLAVIIFSISRLPQIHLNNKRKSIQGLSRITMIFMLFTNILFITSIFINALDIPILEVLKTNLQWILCSIVSFIFDIVLLYQFYIYRQPRSGYTEIIIDI